MHTEEDKAATPAGKCCRAGGWCLGGSQSAGARVECRDKGKLGQAGVVNKATEAAACVGACLPEEAIGSVCCAAGQYFDVGSHRYIHVKSRGALVDPSCQFGCCDKEKESVVVDPLTNRTRTLRTPYPTKNKCTNAGGTWTKGGWRLHEVACWDRDGKAFEDATVQADACSALRSVAAAEPEAMGKIAALGGNEATVVAMLISPPSSSRRTPASPGCPPPVG